MVMDRDRTLSALIARLEALTAREFIARARETSSTRAHGTSGTAPLGAGHRAAAVTAWLGLGGFFARVLSVVDRARA
jgi:hypothetical protein